MNNAFAIRGPLVQTDQILKDGLVIVEEKSILYAGPYAAWNKPLPEPVITVTDGWVCPGFIDMHIHGIGGYDTMDGTAESIQVISRQLSRYGVTSFLATTMTAPFEQLVDVVKSVVQTAEEFGDGAKIVGIHLEGPWINPKYKGAQKEEHILNPTLEQARQLFELSEGLLKVVTIAPEMPGAAEAIQYLKAQGVTVSAGHTGATFAQAQTAIGHGVEHFTHCFNAMTGLHHREPGVVGAAMAHEQLSTELIADAEHVHPAVMRILYKVKQANRLALVSDSMRATGLGEGVFDLGGQQVHVSGQQAKLADGTLAGSILTLNQAVRNMVQLCHVPLSEAVGMASATPAEIIGISDHKGRMEAGYDADIVILNQDFSVAATFVGGKQVYP